MIPVLSVPLTSLALALLAAAAPVPPAPLLALAERFWTWRAATQPHTGDDIPRIDRPAGWVPDWSAAAVADRRARLAGFDREWRAIDTTGWSRAAQVDYRLMGSAIERVRWELDVTRMWQRDPGFYLQQTVGVLHSLLLAPPPFTPARTSELVRQLERIPRTLEEARTNLTEARRPFAKLAVDAVADIRPRLARVAAALAPLCQGRDAARFAPALEGATRALEGYGAWLAPRMAGMPGATAVGREAYQRFLERIAFVPWAPEQLVLLARREVDRAIAFEAYERVRNRGLPELAVFPDFGAQHARESADEERARRFLAERGILTVPDWLRHYRTPEMPAYVAPLAGWGVNDDLTSERRLGEDGLSYRPPPSPSLPYFYLATALDPRPLLVHEGIPGHYMQMALSWAHEDPIRRRYYDSNSNEGIGLYAEEMMLQAGFFDDSPRTREIVYSFMRLRALRVEVDVKLATGEFSIEDAARYLETMVPMDRQTALDEAASFAATPGQAITYQVGKLQILDFLAAARLAEGPAFSLQRFHDALWKNGNVPIALQQWEYLGGGAAR